MNVVVLFIILVYFLILPSIVAIIIIMLNSKVHSALHWFITQYLYRYEYVVNMLMFIVSSIVLFEERSQRMK